MFATAGQGLKASTARGFEGLVFLFFLAAGSLCGRCCWRKQQQIHGYSQVFKTAINKIEKKNKIKGLAEDAERMTKGQALTRDKSGLHPPT